MRSEELIALLLGWEMLIGAAAAFGAASSLWHAVTPGERSTELFAVLTSPSRSASADGMAVSFSGSPACSRSSGAGEAVQTCSREARGWLEVSAARVPPER